MEYGERVVFLVKGEEYVGRYERPYKNKHLIWTPQRVYSVLDKNILGEEYKILKTRERCDFLKRENDYLKNVIKQISNLATKYPELNEILLNKGVKE